MRGHGAGWQSEARSDPHWPAFRGEIADVEKVASSEGSLWIRQQISTSASDVTFAPDNHMIASRVELPVGGGLEEG